MIEIEKQKLLEKLKVQDGTMVTIQQLLNNEIKLEEMVSHGLKVLCLCKEGRGRSKIESENLLVTKRPAIYLRDGIKGLAELYRTSGADFVKIMQILTKVPVIVSYMTPEEITDVAGSALVLKELVGYLGDNWRNRFLGGSSFLDSENRRHYFPPAPSEISGAADDM